MRSARPPGKQTARLRLTCYSDSIAVGLIRALDVITLRAEQPLTIYPMIGEVIYIYALVDSDPYLNECLGRGSKIHHQDLFLAGRVERLWRGPAGSQLVLPPGREHRHLA